MYMSDMKYYVCKFFLLVILLFIAFNKVIFINIIIARRSFSKKHKI